MNIVKAGDILKIKTGRYDANHGVADGKYTFFTCADIPSKANTFSFDDEVLILPGNGANVGNVYHYKGKLEAYQRTYVLYEIDAYPKFLYYYFSKYWIRQITKRQVGSATNYIKMDDIVSFKIPLPPLKTQKHIAQILDDAAALRDKTKQLLTEYDLLAQSIFLDIFGDTWLNKNDFPLRKLSEIVRPDKIITYGIVQAGEEVEDGVPYIRTGDIKDGEILINQLKKTSHKIASAYERSKCSTGDIIMSIRATVGTIAFLPNEIDGANLTQGTARISPNYEIVNGSFLFYLILSQGVQLKIDRETKGATFKEITLGRLRNIQVPIPPINLQNQFAEKIDLIEKQKELAKQELQESEDLFNCLLQKAFKGELV